MQTLAQKAYHSVQNRTASDHALEYTAFDSITRALEHVAEGSDITPAAWAHAVNRNAQLWGLLAVDLLHPDNQLDDETRRALLGLSEFVRRASLRILSGAEEIPDLIAINRTVMQGLVREVAPATLAGAA